MRSALSCVAGLLLLSTATGAGQAPRAVDFTFDFNRWPYPLHQEVAHRLQELARQYPKLARTHNIGKSGEGRDLWVLELTNADTGPAESKPGLWADGNIHAGEVTGRQILTYFAARLLASYGKDPEATRLVDTRAFYVMPIFDADGGERVLTHHPSWPGHRPEEQAGKDLDGDGYITEMRVKDPNGNWYPSPKDPRLMLRVRELMGGRWSYIPTTLEYPKALEEDPAPRDQRYRVYVEGGNLDREAAIDTLQLGLDSQANRREPADFNRNWSAEWRADQPGSGPFPFALPEVRAVATFITSHRNVFFDYTMHSGGGAKNYIVRPPMAHPYEFMPAEDNDFYMRLGAVWSALSGGGVMINDYYSQEARPGRYGQPETGFANDWAYMHLGIHSVLPEIGAAGGKDYDGDGYITLYEMVRWDDEEQGGKHFAPWKPYKHPVLGDVEIGGARGVPQGIGERLKKECEIHYGLLTHIAGLSPLLRLKDLKSARLADGSYRVTAVLQNQGFLSTYVTRQALQIKRDDPITARIKVSGGEVVGEGATKSVGHILGKLAYIRRWSFGADESTRAVEWQIKPEGAGPVTVTVETWAAKAGRDQRTITLRAATAGR